MNALFFLAAAAGAFYLLFAKTAPKALDLTTEGGKQEEIAPGETPAVEKVEIAGRRRPRPGPAQETASSFTGGIYDPAKNPFRKSEPRVDVPQVAPGEFTGSFDDVMPDGEPPDDEDSSADDGAGMGEDMDVDSEDGNPDDNGVI